jgi:hypothetical protein
MSMPLTLEVTEEEAGITVYCPDLDLVTCGDTLGEARENLAALVEEYYLYLNANESQLDRAGQEHLRLYRRFRVEESAGIAQSCMTFLPLFFEMPTAEPVLS